MHGIFRREPLEAIYMLLYAEGRRRTTMILDSYTLIINSAVISFVMMIAMMMVWSVSREHRSALLWASALGAVDKLDSQIV